jgi:apolipoprotein N-acyltransferase
MYRNPLLIADESLADDKLPGKKPELWREHKAEKILKDLSEQAGASLIIGTDALVADANGIKHYNSAAFVEEGVGIAGRYDKMHRVIFGEYIPLRETIPWLRKLTPFSDNFGIAAGENAALFELGEHRFAPVICYEDTVPQLVRGIVKSAKTSGQPVDCLVNLTNDGWFHGSSELDQHLITAQFRAVECRTPLVRAVNTGISAFIDGDGVVLEPDVFFDGDGQNRDSIRDPKTGKYHKQLNAALVHDIPLDNRQSLYVQHGDWFAGTCGLGALCFLIGGLWPARRRSHSAEWEPPSGND